MMFMVQGHMKKQGMEFKIDYYYSQRSSWKDTDKKKLEDILGEFVQGILYSATKKRESTLERQEQHRLYMERQNKIDEIRKQKQHEFQKLKNLEEMSENLHRANKIRDFINEYSKKESLTEENLEWIQWARDKADWLDPLIDKRDEVLERDEEDI